MPNSINTSLGASVALQSLASARRDLGISQDRISTGLKVRSAGDDSAVYAISQTMRSRSAALDAVTDSLKRGKSTVDVALAAGQSVSDLLTQMLATVVAASEGAADPASRVARQQQDTPSLAAYQTKYASLASQLRTFVSTASFNGVNLLDGSTSIYTAQADADGASTISVKAANFTPARRAYRIDDGLQAALQMNRAAVWATVPSTFDVILDGAPITVSLSPTGGSQGDGHYSTDDLAAVINATSGLENTASVDASGYLALIVDNNATREFLTVQNGTGDLLSDPARLADQLGLTAGAAPGATVPADRADGRSICVSGTERFTSLTDYPDLIARLKQSIANVSTSLGTLGAASTAFANHAAFVGKLKDTLTAGVGNLVDADLPRERARLTALQIRQQLSAKALAIANGNAAVVQLLFRRD